MNCQDRVEAEALLCILRHAAAEEGDAPQHLRVAERVARLHHERDLQRSAQRPRGRRRQRSDVRAAAQRTAGRMVCPGPDRDVSRRVRADRLEAKRIKYCSCDI